MENNRLVKHTFSNFCSKCGRLTTDEDRFTLLEDATEKWVNSEVVKEYETVLCPDCVNEILFDHIEENNLKKVIYSDGRAN